jgi:outer membrane immunogenic protein
MLKTLLGTTALAGAMLLAGAANAADLPIRKAPAPVAVAAPFSWSGFYIGAHAGGGWGTKEWSDPFFSTKQVLFPPGVGGGSYNINGFLGGGQIGFNWQSGWVVFGAEADASWTNMKGNGACFFGDVNCSTKVNALGTIVGRIGGTYDRVLLYILGGGAWVREKHTATAVSGGIDGFTVASSSTSSTRWGWTIGGGVEVAFTPNVSGKLQYNYMDFGNKTHEFAFDEGDSIGFRIRQSIHTVKVGLNYRFDWGTPVVARY